MSCSGASIDVSIGKSHKDDKDENADGKDGDSNTGTKQKGKKRRICHFCGQPITPSKNPYQPCTEHGVFFHRNCRDGGLSAWKIQRVENPAQSRRRKDEQLRALQQVQHVPNSSMLYWKVLKQQVHSLMA